MIPVCGSIAISRPLYAEVTVRLFGDCNREKLESQMLEEGWELVAFHQEQDWIGPPKYELAFRRKA